MSIPAPNLVSLCPSCIALYQGRGCHGGCQWLSRGAGGRLCLLAASAACSLGTARDTTVARPLQAVEARPAHFADVGELLPPGSELTEVVSNLGWRLLLHHAYSISPCPSKVYPIGSLKYAREMRLPTPLTIDSQWYRLSVGSAHRRGPKQKRPLSGISTQGQEGERDDRPAFHRTVYRPRDLPSDPARGVGRAEGRRA